MTNEQAEIVYEIFKQQWPAGSAFRYFARDKVGRVHGQVIHGPDDLASTTEFADSRRYNSYVQLNPTTRRSGSKCNAEDISHWSFFVVDIDPVGEQPKLQEAYEYVVGWLRNYLGMLSFNFTTVDSGRGLQLWFPLTPQPLYRAGQPVEMVINLSPLYDRNLDPLSDVKTRTILLREAAAKVQGYWLGLLRERLALAIPDSNVTIDTSVADLPRVMRLPYTINNKTGRCATIQTMNTNQNPGLAEKLITYTPHRLWKETEPPTGLGVVTEATPWQRFLPHLTVAARVFLTEGAEEGGRHRQSAAALLSLKELGCGAEEAYRALLWGGQLCTPRLEEKEIAPMIARHYSGRNLGTQASK